MDRVVAAANRAPVVMHHKRAVAHGERMHLTDGEIPHVGRARHTAYSHDRGDTPIDP